MTRAPLRPRRTLLGSLALFLALPPLAALTAPSAEAAATLPEAARLATGEAEVVESAYYLSLNAPEKVRVGEEFEFSVELEPRGVHKVNSEYPIRMTLVASEGWSSSKEKWGREDARGDAHHVAFSGRAKALAKGRHPIELRVAFSVCSSDQCLVEKKDLRLFVEIQ